MSEGKEALININGEGGLAEYATRLAEELGGQPRSPSHPDTIIAANLKETIAEVKGTATTRGLAARCTIGLSTAAAAATTGLSTRTMRLARQDLKNSNKHDMNWNAKPKLRRKGISTAEHQVVGEWLLSMCPKKSGGKYHMQWITSDELYERYVTAVRTGKLNWRTDMAARSRCRVVFDRIKKEMRIRTAKTFDGQFNCMRCAAVEKEEQNCVELERQTEAAKAAGTLDNNLELKVSLDASQQRVKRLLEHRALRDLQFGYLMQCRYSAIDQERGRRMLVVMDFSKYFYKRNVTMEATTKKERQEYIHDMVMVLESWPREEQLADAETSQIAPVEEKERVARRMRGREKKKTVPRRWVRYVDSICERAGAEGNDTRYVRAAFRCAIEMKMFDVFQRIDLFSDGGPKHYKSVYGMATMAEWYDWWAELRPGVDVPALWWNFTAPYHGHGVADSHAGIFSQMLSRRQKRGQGSAHGTGGGPENDVEIAALMREMKNTTPIVLQSIERPEFRNDLIPLETIKKHFQFRFVRVQQHITLSDGKEEAKAVTAVEYRRNSSDEEEVEGDPWKREFFNEAGTVSKKQPKKRAERVVSVKQEPIDGGCSGGECAPEPVTKKHAPSGTGHDDTKPKRGRPKKKPEAKSKSKTAATEESNKEEVKPKTRGEKMVAAASAVVTTKSGRIVHVKVNK